MLQDDVCIRIEKDGRIISIYRDGLAELLGATILNVQRVSHVEWDNDRKGWTIESAISPHFVSVDDNGTFILTTDGNPYIFPTRKEALMVEEKLFYKLLDSKEDECRQ